MKLKPYPSYKDSGVEWLGKIPEEWDVLPFKWRIARNDGGVWGEDPSGFEDTIVLRSTEQTVDGNWKIEDPAFRSLSENEKLSSTLEEGDLLITKSSGSSLHIGKTTLVTNDIAKLSCCYSNFTQRIRTRALNPKLAWYLMNNEIVRNQFDFLSNSTTGLANLNSTMIGQVVIQAPSIHVQETIVKFLDRETGKLDTLISKQEHLIELLQEKRQAIISHAVTKGLNPDARMKDSGVEWLGMVPEGWVVTLLKRGYTVNLGKMLQPESKVESDELLPYLRAANIQWGGVDVSDIKEMWISKAEKSHLRLEYGDLLVSEGGDVGRSSVWKNELPECYYQNSANRIRSLNGNSNRFLYYWILAVKHGGYIDILCNKSTIAHFTAEKVNALPVAYPEPAEQVMIAEYLDKETNKIDTLIEKAKRSIELAKEHRTALISAAVTGKIDVREAA